LFEGLRVLVIDDSLDNQELIGIMLTRMGAKIDVAVNGSEALARAPKGNYDLLLMDIQMPVMDGHEATRRLRNMGFRKPILALTAHAMKEERCRCKESGFSGFMSKPINKEDLVKTIMEWTKH
jgi:two-component system, sensor histidine kinase